MIFPKLLKKQGGGGAVPLLFIAFPGTWGHASRRKTMSLVDWRIAVE